MKFSVSKSNLREALGEDFDATEIDEIMAVRSQLILSLEFCYGVSSNNR